MQLDRGDPALEGTEATVLILVPVLAVILGVVMFVFGRMTATGSVAAPTRYYRDPFLYRCSCSHATCHHDRFGGCAVEVGSKVGTAPGGCACRLSRRGVRREAERWARVPPTTEEYHRFLIENS